MTDRASERPTDLPPSGRLLAIDWGEKRIGLAVLAVLIVATAITISKRRSVAVGSEPATTEV